MRLLCCIVKGKAEDVAYLDKLETGQEQNGNRSSGHLFWLSFSTCYSIGGIKEDEHQLHWSNSKKYSMTYLIELGQAEKGVSKYFVHFYDK